MTASTRRLTAATGSHLPLVIVGVVAAMATLILTALTLARLSPIVLAIPAGGLMVLLVLAWPSLGVLIATFLVFTNAAVIAVNFHHVPGIVAGVVPLLLAASFVFRSVVRRQEPIVTPAVPWLIGLVAAESLSTIFSANSSAAFDGLVVFLSEGLLLYVLFSNSVDGERSLRAVAWTLLLAGGLLGALSLHQQLTGNFDSNYFGFAQVSNATLGTIDAGQPRLAGPVGEKNHYAQFMLMVIPLGVMLVLHERRRWARLALIVLIGFVTAGMVLTFSRGAAVGLVAIIIVMAALRYVSVRQLVAFGVVIALVLLAVPAYAQRLASLDVADVSADRVIASRATENAAAALVFVDHPLVGVGPDQFPSYYQSYAKEVGLVIHAGERESHNLYLGLAAEIGMLGLLAFLGMVGVTLRDLLRATRRWKFTRPERAALAAGFLLSLVGFLVSSVFLQLSYARYFWMILALAGAAGYILIRLPDTDAPHGDPPAQLP